MGGEGDWADTADVMQNTWLRAFERLETVREPDRLSGWLATTARRECLAVLRRTAREVPDGLFEAEVSPNATCPEAVVLSRETRGMVQLKEPMRAAITPGDLFVLTAGCDRRFSTCTGKFGNGVNFRGEPHVPGLDAMLNYPDAR